MTDATQETCTSKIKKWMITFHKEPCFWLKLLRTSGIIILILAVIYTVVTSAFEYFHEPNPLTDPDRLGQFGDFLGGTLNPIFGFFTICLLLWSIFIQRKELKLTRSELKKAAKYQKKQANLNKLDFEKKQLENAANSCLYDLENLFHKKIYINPIKAAGMDLTKMGTPNTSWYDLIYDGSITGNTEISSFIPTSTINLEAEKIKHILLLLAMNVHELIKTDKYVSLVSVKEYWKNRLKDFIDNCSVLGIIPDDELPTYEMYIKL